MRNLFFVPLQVRVLPNRLRIVPSRPLAGRGIAWLGEAIVMPPLMWVVLLRRRLPELPQTPSAGYGPDRLLTQSSRRRFDGGGGWKRNGQENASVRPDY
jgi:hypothetical protein